MEKYACLMQMCVYYYCRNPKKCQILSRLFSWLTRGIRDLTYSASISEAVHMEMLLCVNTFCIVLADCLNGPCEHSACKHAFFETHHPTPQPLAFNLLRPPHIAQTPKCLIWPLSDHSVASCLTHSAEKLHWNTLLRRAEYSTVVCTFCTCARCNKRVALVLWVVNERLMLATLFTFDQNET